MNYQSESRNDYNPLAQRVMDYLVNPEFKELECYELELREQFNKGLEQHDLSADFFDTLLSVAKSKPVSVEDFVKSAEWGDLLADYIELKRVGSIKDSFEFNDAGNHYLALKEKYSFSDEDALSYFSSLLDRLPGIHQKDMDSLRLSNGGYIISAEQLEELILTGADRNSVSRLLELNRVRTNSDSDLIYLDDDELRAYASKVIDFINNYLESNARFLLNDFVKKLEFGNSEFTPPPEPPAEVVSEQRESGELPVAVQWLPGMPLDVHPDTAEIVTELVVLAGGTGLDTVREIYNFVEKRSSKEGEEGKKKKERLEYRLSLLNKGPY